MRHRNQRKLACLAEDGKLQPGELWRQASIIGSQFTASYTRSDAGIIPTIRGEAWVCGDTRLILNPGRSLLLGDRVVNHGDVIVIGAGIVGAACAWRWRNAGKKCFARRSPAGRHRAGMGHLVCMDDDPAELALSAWSLACWRTLTPRMPERCAWRGCGTLWLAETPQELEIARESSGEWPHIRSPARCRPPHS